MLVSFFIRVVSLTYPVLVSFFIGGVSLTHLVLASFLSGDFLLHIPCWLHVSVGSFSYTSRAGLFFLFLFFFFFSFFFFLFYVGIFSGMQSFLKTSPKEKSWVEDGPEKIWKSHTQNREGTLQHPIQSRTKPNKSFSYTSSAGVFVWGVSLTHPVLASLCGEFPYVEIFLHILCWLLFVWSFSYMYCASFFMWRVSLTHPMLAALCGLFLLHFHAWFFVCSFSYTSYAGCIMCGASLTYPMLAV